MIKSSWYAIPAAFLLLINFLISPVKSFFWGGLVYFLFFISLFFFLRRFNLNRIIKLSIGGVAFVIFLYGIIQKFFLFPHYLKILKPGDNFYSKAFIARVESGRIFSIFTLPALYAIICGIFILFILHYLFDSERKIYWVGLLILGLINLILTQSFGGLLYLSIGILFYLFMSGILNLRFLAPIIMVLSLFFFIVVGLRFSEVKKLEPLKLRLSNWNQALRVIKANPLWGIGLGNYEAEISYHVRTGESLSIYSHNFFLQFVSETGLLFAFWILILLFFERKKLKPPDQKDRVVFIPAFFILLFYNLLDIGFYFFSSALVTVVVLSQIFLSPVKVVKKNWGKFALNLVLLGTLGMLLIFKTISDDYQKKGEFYLNQKMTPDSYRFYQKSLVFNPFNYRSEIGLGLIAFSEENFENSQSHLQRVFRIFPDSAFAHYLMSKIRFREGRFFIAFQHASKAYFKDNLNAQYQSWYINLKNNLQEKLLSEGSK